MRVGTDNRGRRYGFIRSLPAEHRVEVVSLETGRTHFLPEGTLTWREVYPAVIPGTPGRKENPDEG